MNHTLTPKIAARFAEIALGHVTCEYPHKLDHVMDGPEDVLGPRALHPIFFGSFDWHSCVHGYWLLMRLRRLFPAMSPARRIDALMDEMLTPASVAGELSYLDRAYSGGFERPYGWAWLLALHREAQRHDRTWGDDLAPIAAAFADRFKSYLRRLTYPIRTGTHFNTAFALILALEWAEHNDPALAAQIRARARDYYGDDCDCRVWEPGGDDFLSSALVEALCMRRALGDDAQFRDWLGAFLPDLAQGRPQGLFTPAFVSDRSDGKIAHLDGFNLTRAWCWRGIADALPDPMVASMAAAVHLDASLPHVSGDYMGEHWLATFALLALDNSSSSAP
jgi:hypothetical protein